MLYYLFLGLTIILTIILTLVAQIQVSIARNKYKIVAPKTVGDDNFERVFRAHQNQLEANNIFLPLVYLQFFTGTIAINIFTSIFGGQYQGGLLLNIITTLLLVPNFAWLIGRAIYIYAYNVNNTKIKLIGGIGASIAFIIVLVIVIIGGTVPFIIF